MTLHEAMIRVLITLPTKSAPAKFLSETIKEKQLYHNQHGGFADTIQVRTRAINYPQYFEFDGKNIKLIRDPFNIPVKKREKFLPPF
ncbi:hypothetical protein ASZ90_017235 [hydrocarbon metagenome]|uniref:Uncharacterized protein n=1 Tax=hydrocarbon metagenome TaxID=938273 RepID=A0A0W8EA90_9ZZZZ